MYHDEYLFLPEAKLVDKLLSVFNIQSQQKLDPSILISILGLLNLLNIVSLAQNDNSTSINGLSNLINNQNEINSDSIDINQIQQLINNSNNSNNNINTLLSKLLNQNNNSNNNINNIIDSLGNGKLDPTLILKLMNLINHSKRESNENENFNSENNSPIKSKPYDQEEEN